MQVHNNMEVGPVDTCHSPSDLVPCQLLPVEDPDTPLYGGQNNMLVNGGAAENVSCEGGDESNQTVNLNDDHLCWEMLTYGEGHQTNDLVDCDPSVVQLYCSEKLNGDPLVQVSTTSSWCRWSFFIHLFIRTLFTLQF